MLEKYEYILRLIKYTINKYIDKKRTKNHASSIVIEHISTL